MTRLGMIRGALAIAVLAALGTGASADEGKWVSLFDGKDLKGWTTAEGGTGNWKVVDGAITCTGPASHLFTERGDYKNFRYKAEISINDGGNSGMYFRTQKKPGFPPGYEAQVNSTHGDPVRTGSLYNRHVIKERLVEPDTWFTQEVEVVGNKITVFLDGKKLYEYTDEKNEFPEGHFAFQHHDPTCKVKIRKVEVQELP